VVVDAVPEFPISIAGTGNRYELFAWYLACRRRGSEQQDRLSEQRRAERRGGTGATRPVEKRQQVSCCSTRSWLAVSRGSVANRGVVVV